MDFFGRICKMNNAGRISAARRFNTTRFRERAMSKSLYEEFESEITITKKCKQCGEIKNLEEFYKQSNCKLGRTARCKDCINSNPFDVVSSKLCPKCNKEKSSDFFRFDSRTNSGLKSWCKECEKDQEKERRQRPEVKSELAKRMREYRQRPEAKPGIKATSQKQYLKNRGTERYKQALKRSAKRYRAKTPRHNIHIALKHAVRRRPTVNPITTDEVMVIWKKQNGRCAVSGVEMTWGKGRIMPTSVSIDRLDGSRGYEKDNIRLVCYQVNTFRGRWSDEQMLVMAKAIIAHMEDKA